MFAHKLSNNAKRSLTLLAFVALVRRTVSRGKEQADVGLVAGLALRRVTDSASSVHCCLAASSDSLGLA